MAQSVALIVPDEHKAVADAVSVVLGHTQNGFETYTAPLSATGDQPVTHWGCHTRADDSFVDIVQAGKAGSLPAVDWGVVGLTEAQVLAMVAALELRARPMDDYTINFDALLAQQSLQRVMMG